jgi:monothiol glutaredoxin
MVAASPIDWDGVTLMVHGTSRAPKGPRSALALWLMVSAGVEYRVIDVSVEADARAEAILRSGMDLFPQIYVDGEFIGGGEVIAELRVSGFFTRLAIRPSRPCWRATCSEEI